MTPVEKTRFERRRREVQEEENKLRARLKEVDPACWSWPIPPLPSDDHPLVRVEGRPAVDGLATPRARVQFWLFHDGHCAICGHADLRMVEDHDHRTGRVRGRLCTHCNTSEPHDTWPNSVFERYRAHNPATILGYTSQYVDPMTRKLDWGEPAWAAKYRVPDDVD